MPKLPVVVRNVEVRLRRLPASVSGLRLVHLSDFHFRRWTRVYQSAQSLLLDLPYDLLLVTGDLGDNHRLWQRSAELARRFFEPLVGRSPIYAVLGNHDRPELARDDAIPIRFLRNEHVEIEVSNTRLQLAGVEQSEAADGELQAALGSTNHGSDITFLLAHFPSTVFRLPADCVDLMLAGHTHGGQIRLPGLGCVWPNDAIPRSMARGLHVVNGTALHVTPGIGTSPPIRVRFHCRPEITSLTLQSVESNSTIEAGRNRSGQQRARAAILD